METGWTLLRVLDWMGLVIVIGMKQPTPSLQPPSMNHQARLAIAGLAALISPSGVTLVAEEPPRPNILLTIADDWSWLHNSASGCPFVNTPNFDRVANEGVRFVRAYSACPICTPSRGCLLTGMNPWQLEQGAVLLSHLPADYPTYPALLQQSGYAVGYTGKGWAPGNPAKGGRSTNPAGPAYNSKKLTKPTTGISDIDYAANFDDFLARARQPSQPFCFWYGANEPHVAYQTGSGEAGGKNPASAIVPPFLPDNTTIRGDLLDYAREVEWFDEHLGRILAKLEAIGELNNTVIIVTGDNGMPFARAKGTCYDYGTHIPLVVRWPATIAGGRVVDDFVSFVDLAPTILEIAGLTAPEPLTGRSLMAVLQAPGNGQIDPARTWVLNGRERQNHARYDFTGYPIRSLHEGDYLYVRNFAPERWPAGDPVNNLFLDIDPLPGKDWLIAHQSDPAGQNYFTWATAKRPAEELFHLPTDPGCLDNLAGRPEEAARLVAMRNRLEDLLRSQNDPRVLGYGDIFDSYPWYAGANPAFGGYNNVQVPNPAYVQSAASAMLSDADQDRLPLAVEIALGTNPNAASIPDLTVAATPSDLIVSTPVLPRIPGLRFKMQWSNDLAVWSPASVTTTADTPGQPMWNAQATVPLTGTSTFIRLAVEMK